MFLFGLFIYQNYLEVPLQCTYMAMSIDPSLMFSLFSIQKSYREVLLITMHTLVLIFESKIIELNY